VHQILSNFMSRITSWNLTPTKIQFAHQSSNATSRKLGKYEIKMQQNLCIEYREINIHRKYSILQYTFLFLYWQTPQWSIAILMTWCQTSLSLAFSKPKFKDWMLSSNVLVRPAGLLQSSGLEEYNFDSVLVEPTYYVICLVLFQISLVVLEISKKKFIPLACLIHQCLCTNSVHCGLS